MLLIIVFFVHSFVSLGYYISPDDNIINEQDELVEQIDNADIKGEELRYKFHKNCYHKSAWSR